MRAIIIALMSAIFGCATAMAQTADTLLQDMVKFDQHYIPTLAFTSDEKLEPSRAMMKALKPVWKKFKVKYYQYKPADNQWQTDFDQVTKYIAQADKIVADGKNLKDAHESLEHVRMVFLALRTRNAIPYYIDNLTRFHEPMEKIVLAGKGKTEQSLTPADLDTMRHTLPEARLLWNMTVSAPLDAALFGFNKQQSTMVKSLVDNELQALNHLEQTLATDDRKAIISAAVAIKPNFAKIFKMFGRFPEKSP